MCIQRPLLALALLLTATTLPAQNTFPDGRLDPTRTPTTTAQPLHTPLPEQYLWTAGDVTALRRDRGSFPASLTELRTDPHFFRAHFKLASLPAAATLYLAGPREAHVYLNGRLLADFASNLDAPINFHVFHADATQALRIGDNTLAIEAIRGRGVPSEGGSIPTRQLAYGEVLAAKIVPAPFGVEAPALVLTDTNWRSTTARTSRWQDPAFNDRDWLPAASLGSIEDNIDLFQWNADAGMYAWPGYMGMSQSLRTFELKPQTVTHIYAGRSRLTNLDALTKPSATPFAITLPGIVTDADAPTLLLDFGREISGRLLVESACDCIATLSIAYGESEIEAMSTGLAPGRNGGNILGTNLLEVPARGTARGPKSGFRYVRISFLRGAATTAFKSIRVEGIYYPVDYAGHFQSSDPLLNRIWETGAYTAHLCMQDGIWDAIKRDRGRWAGDLDVAGRVISTVFGDRRLIEQTLRLLVPEGTGPAPAINGIPGYSAQWIADLYGLYLRSADKDFLASQRDNLLRVLAGMDTTLDANGLLANTQQAWLFVDWAPGLHNNSPETRIGTQLQYIRAYTAAARLFTWMGDARNSAKYEARARAAIAAAQANFRDPRTETYGSTWQLNALAALAIPNPDNTALWTAVLSHVKQDSPADPVITPYFNAYVIDAMASLGHRREALDWIRQYWGGMLAEGATSFWEGYDLRWPKSDPHLSLQADNTSGYFVSLAHGWSSGPTAWLAENILGITPLDPGYDTVSIHPDLLDLSWAYGSVPTPHGLIKINLDKQRGIVLDLPRGVTKASVTFTPTNPAADVYLNGRPAACGKCLSNETPPLRVLELTAAGHYEITTPTPPSAKKR
ncbi:alpha-L-rhamnosidase C-terminal domain-containing protein [Edaphobacter aggregans]|uniref:alpha-L-rhamnosidase-related protein n=1 Tax=Edaphobacter aggregans TaxID=570835 RepID=UPI00055517C6|nr:alpha-L-rhamnosidase C-terminal domain-containing protein [Edaphobacter aggregans]